LNAITTNLSLFKKDYEGVIRTLDYGVRLARDEMAHALEQLAKHEIKGKRAKGEKATAGEPPKNRTGNLRRSITSVKKREGFGMYSAEVGPTMKYSRAVEEGGKSAPPSWHGTTAMRGFPYMKPAWDKFKANKIMEQIVHKHLDGF